MLAAPGLAWYSTVSNSREHWYLARKPCGRNHSLVNLTSLVCLNCRETGLKSLPSFFRKLRTIEELNLSYNSFSSFPHQICSLKRLKCLEMMYNQLDTGTFQHLEFYACWLLISLSLAPTSESSILLSVSCLLRLLTALGVQAVRCSYLFANVSSLFIDYSPNSYGYVC